MAPKKKVDPFAEFQAPAAQPASSPGADAFAEFQTPAEPTRMGELDQRAPGQDIFAAGSVGDKYIRPIGNAGRTTISDFQELGRAAKAGVSNTINAHGGNVVGYLRDQARALAHPIDAHNEAVQKVSQAGMDANHPYDGTTGYVTNGQIPRVTEAMVSEGAGHLATQGIMAELTDGVLSTASRPLEATGAGALKERARSLARGVLGADKNLSRKAVTEAIEKTAKSDAHAVATNAELATIRTRRREAQQELGRHTEVLKTKTEQIKTTANNANNQRWAQLREKIGDDPVEIKPVKHAIEAAESYMLPEEVKQFRQILATQDPPEPMSKEYKDWFVKSRQLGEDYDSLDPRVKAHVDEAAEMWRPSASVTDETKPANFSRIQGWYTELGQKMYGGGNLPGNVRNGLRSVRDSLGAVAERVADSKGALEDLKGARKSHQQYQEAFGKQRTQRLSAAERARKRANPKAYAQEAQGLERQRVAVHDPAYLQHAEAVDKARSVYESFPSEEQLTNKLESPVEAPVVDIHKLAKDQIEKRAGQWAQFNKRDIGIISSSIIATPVLVALGERSFGVAQMAGVAAYEGGTRALASIALRPGMAEWFAQAPAGELEALRKIPGADRVRIIDGLTQVGVEAAEAGKKIAVSGPVASFIGQKNVRLIAAATAARMTGSSIKTPREAREKLQMPDDDEE